MGGWPNVLTEQTQDGVVPERRVSRGPYHLCVAVPD